MEEDPFLLVAKRLNAIDEQVARINHRVSVVVSALSMTCGRHDALSATILGLLGTATHGVTSAVTHELESLYADLLQISENAEHIEAFEQARDHVHSRLQTPPAEVLR